MVISLCPRWFSVLHGPAVIVQSRVLYLFSLFIHLFPAINSGFYLNFLLTIVSRCLKLPSVRGLFAVARGPTQWFLEKLPALALRNHPWQQHWRPLIPEKLYVA